MIDQQITLTMPDDAKGGNTIHAPTEVQDSGTHRLKHYQRVVITVA